MRRLLISIIAAISLFAQPAFASGFSSIGSAASPTTLIGDATGTGTGTVPVTISALPLSKLATQAASTLTGNATGSTAVPTAISLGSNFTFSGSTLYGAVAHPGYVAGNWYNTLAGVNITSGTAIASGSIRLIPFTISKPISIAQLGARVTTASASGNFQLAIYANGAAVAHATGTAICTTGNMSTTSGAVVTAVATCTGTLNPGAYWMAVNQDNAAAAYASTAQGDTTEGYLAGSATAADLASSSSVSNGVMVVAQTFGTWPDLTSATFSANVSSQAGALVFMKAQ